MAAPDAADGKQRGADDDLAGGSAIWGGPWVRSCSTAEKRRRALLEGAHRHNGHWLLERHDFLPPGQARREPMQPVRAACLPPPWCLDNPARSRSGQDVRGAVSYSEYS
ncbi:hypothetical protein [Pyxidicoccus xibeiensis]|uniref:hypothetical protein n=1 Tax=Pyxidicoccus xibeiensis TaxID=2906759 RepID=UPI0020A795D7|nr:hypothetical protein [Pyxidicoccus xibeiensis]MCP3143256.1 hypothetical protein [Pyxidicoccus xibeiensis]